MKLFRFAASLIVVALLVSCQTPAAPPAPPAEEEIAASPTLPPDNTPITTEGSVVQNTNTPNAPTKTVKAPELPTPEQAEDCSQGWTQLKTGIYARVAGDENEPPNRVRSGPSRSDEVIAQIYPGAIVEMVGGPVCDDSLVF